FEDVVQNWGFSAVLLAIGAWRDRPLPIEGIDEYVGKGLIYQNPFFYWFNHFHEPGFSGPQPEIADGAIVVGGGLASLDVCKALMMLTVEKALKARGIETNILELDKGINRVLDEHGLTLDDLGLKGCTLFYRRRRVDMPLSPVEATSPEEIPKIERLREKILANAQRKFLFNVEPLHVPTDKIVENGRLTGLVFQRTRVENGKVEPIEGSEREVRAPLVVSSIGSIPVPIKGIPMKWQTFDVDREKCCRIRGFSNVFALGNTVTGRGNINESLKHGRQVATRVAEDHLADDPEAIFDQQVSERAENVAGQVSNITTQIEKLSPASPEKQAEIRRRVKALQERVGYQGDFMEWVKKHLPVRLENIVGH
ncbi:MAG: hypothetical protein D6714_11055, partial [Bacteroidetes bacterium]